MLDHAEVFRGFGSEIANLRFGIEEDGRDAGAFDEVALVVVELVQLGDLVLQFFVDRRQLLVRAPLAPLDDHARILDAGVARIIDETRHIHIRTRQLLAQTAVNVLRARLNAPG